MFLFDGGIGERNRREQRLRVGMVRRVVYCLCGADLPHLAQVHDCDIVREMAYHAQIMADEHHGDAELRAQVEQQIQNASLDRDIQGGHRLVAQHQVRMSSNGPGNGHPLLLAAAQLAGQPVIVRPVQLDDAQQAEYLFFGLVPRQLLEAPQRARDLVAHYILKEGLTVE